MWAELRQSSPDPDVLAEGRIVASASLADAGDLPGAIAMLSTAGASKALRNPSERHVRQWYLLADLYERAGDVPRAREYFERVFRTDPEAYDVAERLRGLGPDRPARTRRTRTPTSTKKRPTPTTTTQTPPRPRRPDPPTYGAAVVGVAAGAAAVVGVVAGAPGATVVVVVAGGRGRGRSVGAPSRSWALPPSRASRSG